MPPPPLPKSNIIRQDVTNVGPVFDPPTLPNNVIQQFEEFAAPQPTLLTVQLENVTAYFQDAVDLTSLAKQITPVSITAPNNFASIEVVGDIVSINSDPNVKGLYLSKNIVTMSSPKATPGSGTMIADVKIVGFRHDIVKILRPDPNDPTMWLEVGSITAAGVSGQPPIPPGGPLEIQGGDWAITGGTGAFLGVTGQMGGPGPPPPGSTPPAARNTSVTEDPSYRRINISNAANASPPPPPATWTAYLYVIPLMPPQVVGVCHVAPPGHYLPPPVTYDNPASVGETLILYATGLGPVRYWNVDAWVDVPIGQSFPPGATVISPVTVTIGDTTIPSSALSAQGVPGFSNGYSVEFTVPSDFSSGALLPIQISSAWIQSAAVNALYVAAG